MTDLQSQSEGKAGGGGGVPSFGSPRPAKEKTAESPAWPWALCWTLETKHEGERLDAAGAAHVALQLHWKAQIGSKAYQV